MTVRALEFYSGIGGLHLALTRSQINGQVVQSFDWDQTACLVYGANYENIVRKIDISTLNPYTLSSLKANLWLFSPACQPYTVLNPNAKGEEDPRAQSFIHLIRNVLPELASSDEHPERLLVENVGGFESSSTRHLLLSTLRSIGYTTLELLLTPLQFGIPNSRLRYYLLAKKSPLSFALVPDNFIDHVWRQIPGLGVPLETLNHESSTQCIGEYLDVRTNPEDLFVSDRVLERWGRLFDIVLPSSQRTCCFTRGYTQLVERAGSILQENEALDTTNCFDSFLEAQSRGEVEAVKILHPLRLRYFSPSELLRIFAFEPLASNSQSSFKWPPTVSRKSKYKLIGNSVNVKVVEELIRYLYQD